MQQKFGVASPLPTVTREAVRRLMLAPVLIMVLFLGLTAAAYFGLVSQYRLLSDLFDVRFRNYQSSAQLLGELTSVNANLYRGVNWATVGVKTSRIDSLLKEQVEVIDRNLALLHRLVSEAKLERREKELLLQVQTDLNAYRTAAVGIVGLVSVDIGAANLCMSNAEGKFRRLRADLDLLMSQEKLLAQFGYNHGVGAYWRSSAAFAVLLGVAVFLSTLFTVYLSSLLLMPLCRPDSAGVDAGPPAQARSGAGGGAGAGAAGRGAGAGAGSFSVSRPVPCPPPSGPAGRA